MGVGATPRREVVLALGAVALLGLGMFAIPNFAPATGAREAPTVPSATSAGCVRPLPPSGVSGSLALEGGPLGPNATAGVELAYTYSVPVTVLASGKVTYSCLTLSNSTVTGANGTFAFIPPTPASTCGNASSASSCVAYGAPDAPVRLTVPHPPAGYGVSVEGHYASISVVLVCELTSVTLNPVGPTVTTTPGAETPFVASAWAANGTPSPLAVTYRWDLRGTGWSFDGPIDGPAVALLAVQGASAATLSVLSAASVGATVLAPPAVSVAVVAVPTTIQGAETDRTTLDVGDRLAVNVTAWGAAGFPYAAYVDPGLGQPTVGAPCTVVPSGTGTILATCEASVTYPAAGTAQPSVNVTNGYSSASWRLPDLTVEPPPSISVSPAAPEGYAGAPLPITLVAANGTGTAPYSGACLAPGPGPVLCEPGPGPRWTFRPTYPDVGNYTARAWALDADGTNASLSVPVVVVAPLAVGPLNVSPQDVTAGTPVRLEANVTGGVLPARYWWNVSSAPGPLSTGELVAAGALAVTLVPALAGALEVRLTVVDDLGTVTTADRLLEVGPAPASLVVARATPPGDPVTVGTPVALSWQAFDVSGAPDRTFGATGELVLSSAAGAPIAWANASGVGPLSSLEGGGFGVPAAAWIDGMLNVTLVVATAGTFTVRLASASLPAAVPGENLTTTADRLHVRLFDPVAGPSDARASSTFWHLEDRFGNPAPGAVLSVDLVAGGRRTVELVGATPLPGGGSGVWINYSVPGTAAAEVSVVDGAGEVLLGPLEVPATPPARGPSASVVALAAAAPLGLAGMAAVVVARRRRRRRSSEPGEEDLRRFAEGRDRVVELVGRLGPVDLAALEGAWAPPPPPPELADWIASLVADGTLGATLGPDGRARFRLASGPAGAPRVTLDPEAFEDGLRRRDEELGSDEPAS